MPKKSRIPNSSKLKDLPPAHEMVIEMLRTFRKYTTTSKARCTGQCTVERKDGPPTVVMYSSYPNGDYLCWFNDGTGFVMYALVNENLKHVISCNADDLPKLVAEAQKLEPKLGL